MTNTETERCQHCDDLITPSPALTGPRWRHANGEALRDRHLAWPVLRCPRCGSEDYKLDQSDPWSDYLRCEGCGQTDRVPLGN